MKEDIMMIGGRAIPKDKVVVMDSSDDDDNDDDECASVLDHQRNDESTRTSVAREHQLPTPAEVTSSRDATTEEVSNNSSTFSEANNDHHRSQALLQHVFSSMRHSANDGKEEKKKARKKNKRHTFTTIHRKLDFAEESYTANSLPWKEQKMPAITNLHQRRQEDHLCHEDEAERRPHAASAALLLSNRDFGRKKEASVSKSFNLMEPDIQLSCSIDQHLRHSKSPGATRSGELLCMDGSKKSSMKPKTTVKEPEIIYIDCDSGEEPINQKVEMHLAAAHITSSNNPEELQPKQQPTSGLQVQSQTYLNKPREKKSKRKRSQVDCLLDDAAAMRRKPSTSRFKSEPANDDSATTSRLRVKCEASAHSHHQTLSKVTLLDLHATMDVGYLSDCKDLWKSYCQKFVDFDEGDAKELKRVAFNRMLKDRSCGEKQQLHHIWACDRYDDPREGQNKIVYKGIPKNFYDRMRASASSRNDDALQCLDFLLEQGSDLWQPMPSNGQTVLHMCIAKHHKCVLNALLKRKVIELEHLLQLDKIGETPIHSAVSGQSFECLLMLMKAFPPNLWVEKAVDSRGNTVLHQLCRYSDIEYGQARPDYESSRSFLCLKHILELLENDKQTLYRVLAQVNFAGDTVMCVAAKCGVYFEAKLLTSVRRFDVCSAIVCGRAITSKGTRYVSPLKLCNITIERIESILLKSSLGRTMILRFKDDGVEGLEPYFDNEEMLKTWLHFAEKTRELLTREAKPKPLHLEDIEQLRKGTKVARLQLCTKQAHKLKERMAENWKQEQYKKEFVCDSATWPQRLWKTKSFQDQVRYALTRETMKHVRPCLIRDPMHPCSRYGDPKEPHFGLFATRDIAVNTVICQYSGLVQRETKESFGENAPYGFKLHGIDSFLQTAGEKVGPYDYSYILDAAKYFNEGALINDIRNDLLEDCDDLPPAFEQNCQFAEVLYNGWPHVLLISTKSIEKGEELLTDYSYEYWVRFRNELLDQKVKDLEATVAKLTGGKTI